MQVSEKNKTAIWVITPNGVKLAQLLIGKLSETDVYVSRKIEETPPGYISFESLSETINHHFNRYCGHIFIMSTGIVVRVIAPLVKSKLEDPAVVVIDDRAHHVISLLSGHLGGANALTLNLSDIIGADPVITTATDVNRLPAIDVLAKEKNLWIENPGTIKTVNMALLKGEKILLHDPYGILGTNLPQVEPCTYGGALNSLKKCRQVNKLDSPPGIYVDDIVRELPPEVMVLRPASMAAGIGCNRNTRMEEMKVLLEGVLETNHLAPFSLKFLASIDVKSDENGLLSLAETLSLPLIFYNRQELNQVKAIKNPSAMVKKHVGVKSVCEAAAILATGGGSLIVPKQTTPNATVAIARINFSSSASDPAASSI